MNMSVNISLISFSMTRIQTWLVTYFVETNSTLSKYARCIHFVLFCDGVLPLDSPYSSGLSHCSSRIETESKWLPFGVTFSDAFEFSSYEDCCILIKISLNLLPKGPINVMPALIQIMAWCQTGHKPLSRLMRALFTDVYMHHSALVH